MSDDKNIPDWVRQVQKANQEVQEHNDRAKRTKGATATHGSLESEETSQWAKEDKAP